jgi:hypothetical protein
VEELDLLDDELDRVQDDVLPHPLDVLEIFDRRVAVADLPQNVGEEEQERNGAADPDPGLDELAALPCQEQRGHDGAAEKERRVLVLDSEPGQNPEPHPQP